VPASLTSANCDLYRFGPYEADLDNHELRKFGVRVQLERKPWQLLVLLIQRPGELVGRPELQRELWPEGTYVDFDLGLNVAIRKVRGALCDSAEEPKYIETVAGHGYRFVGKVERAPATTSPSTPAPISVLDSRREPPIHMDDARWWRTRKALSVFAAVIGIAVLVLTWSRSLHKPRQLNAAGARKIMLVVLPFDNLSGNSSQEYLSDGMTEELSEQLGNANPRQLGVIGRTSAMTYKHSRRTIRQIGQELGVDYVLEGSVRREQNKLRVTAQLVEVTGQTHVWAQDYDGDVRDLFKVEDEVATEIVRQVGVAVALGEPTKPRPAHLPNLEAHEAYLLAQYYLNKRTPAGHDVAVRYLRHAIELDPHYAAAYAELAKWVDRKEGLAFARKAVDLDPDSGEVRAALGWFELIRTLDLPAAESTLRSAIQLSPNYAPAHHAYSGVLESSGRLQEAINEERRAVQLDPLALIFRASLAETLSLAGQYDRAVWEINQIFTIDPQYPKAHETLATIYLRMGMYKEAIGEYEASERYGAAKASEFIAYAYARMGNKDQALELLSELQKSPDYTRGFGAALIEIGLSNNQMALDLLEKTYQQHEDDGLLWLKTDPIFDPLRSDPRFERLLRQMKFPL